ncbi:protein of unknown function [Citrobacter freundii]|nr:protein of unknown function [Citrobacter freundii]
MVYRIWSLVIDHLKMHVKIF